MFNSLSLSKLGLQIGGGGVEIFFAVSALLYGMKWRNENYKGFEPIFFLKKRMIRIFIPLWILILAVIPLECFITNRFEFQTILFNVIGLGWAKPFGIAGHLWYITMLMILYFSFIVFSHFRLDKVKPFWWVIVFTLFGVSYLYGQNYLTTFSKAGPLLFIYFGALLFSKGKDIINWAEMHKANIIVIALTTTGISLYIYQLGWHDTHKAMAVASFIISGFFTFLALYACIQPTRENKAVRWLSNISYEIYLVHMPIIPLVSKITDYVWVNITIGVSLSILLAVGLNKLTNSCISIIKK